MTDEISIATIISEVGAKGILLSLGKGAVQLAVVVGCVALVRHILKRLNKTRGAGLRVGWSVDEAEARREYGAEPQGPDEQDET